MQQSEKKLKVLIACPTLGIDPDPDRWLNSLLKILNNVRREGFTHAMYMPYRQSWWPANNEIWNVALTNKFDYILRIDDDIHGVPHDAFTKLLNADKDVIGAAYCNRRFPYMVQALVRVHDKVNMIEAFKTDEKMLQAVQFHGYQGKGVEKVDLIGFGMTLIKTSPFKYLERPLYKGNEVCPDDSYFAQICLENGIKQYVHFGVRINHAHVTFANAGHLYNADVIESNPEVLKDKSKVLLASPNDPLQESQVLQKV